MIKLADLFAENNKDYDTFLRYIEKKFIGVPIHIPYKEQYWSEDEILKDVVFTLYAVELQKNKEQENIFVLGVSQVSGTVNYLHGDGDIPLNMSRPMHKSSMFQLVEEYFRSLSENFGLTLCLSCIYVIFKK
jgi:hypothetical protein